MRSGFPRNFTRGPCGLLLAIDLMGAYACADSGAATDAATSTGTTPETSTSTSTPTSTQSATQGTPTGTATGGTGPVEGFSPEPRWVLRDRDGVRVQALVEPRCGQWSDSEATGRCRPLEFDSPNSFPCARVVDHEGRYLNLLFDLKTGKLDPCMFTADKAGDINQPWNQIPGAAFTNAECAGTAYSNLFGEIGSIDYTRAHTIWFADGEMWLVSEKDCLVSNFWWSDFGTCKGPGNLSRRCPFVVVPDWVKNLLPNPPYTMSVEYG